MVRSPAQPPAAAPSWPPSSGRAEGAQGAQTRSSCPAAALPAPRPHHHSHEPPPGRQMRVGRAGWGQSARQRPQHLRSADCREGDAAWNPARRTKLFSEALGAIRAVARPSNERQNRGGSVHVGHSVRLFCGPDRGHCLSGRGFLSGSVQRCGNGEGATLSHELSPPPSPGAVKSLLCVLQRSSASSQCKGRGDDHPVGRGRGLRRLWRHRAVSRVVSPARRGLPRRGSLTGGLWARGRPVP